MFMFEGPGYLVHKFEESELSFLRQEVSEIQENLCSDKHTKCNHNLAGNLEYEFGLNKSKDKLSQLMTPMINDYLESFKFFEFKKLCEKLNILSLERLWVNFQQKNEFNPVHDHSGILSFVIYLEVPYDIEDEKKKISSINSNMNVPAHFSFLYTDSLGEIQQQFIPVDRTFRNTMILFPSRLRHCVYPFYTSDELRISVAGNFVADVQQ